MTQLSGIICTILFISVFISCKDDDFVTDGVLGDPFQYSCDNVQFGPWESSEYVLPYPVGQTYRVDLNACSTSYHSPGLPDQFAVDFNMEIGTTITASKAGEVVYVEESGEDFNTSINNVVVVSHGGDKYSYYMHLTNNGAAVEVGDMVVKGSVIGYSGATGLAGYPHLHFVVAYGEDTFYPYQSIPVNFKNTSPNPNSLDQGEYYLALPY